MSSSLDTIKDEKKESTLHSKSAQIKCDNCKTIFPSKNALFRHLRVNANKCLSESEHEDYLASTLTYEKIVLLYGYIPSQEALQISIGEDDVVTASSRTNSIPKLDQEDQEEEYNIRGGDDAAFIIMKAVQMIHDLTYKRKNKEYYTQQNSLSSINRSFGCISRMNPIIAQDNFTGAATEVMTCRVPPLLSNSELPHWVQQMNKILNNFLPDPKQNGSIRIFGRLSIPSKFNAEFDVTHRKMEYLLPADFLYSTSKDSYCHGLGSRSYVFDRFPSFRPGSHPVPVHPKSNTEQSNSNHFNNQDNHNDDDDDDDSNPGRPDPNIRDYLYKIKKIMQRLTTQIEVLDTNDESAILEKQFHDLKRRKNKLKHDKKHQHKKQKNRPAITTTYTEKQTSFTCDNETNPNQDSTLLTNTNDLMKQHKNKSFNKNKKKNPHQPHVLRRKRYHNFTPTVMAHDFLAFRRMDRFYHRATIRFDDLKVDIKYKNQRRPFIVFSITGDQFLLGQVRGVIGLFLAIVRGNIDEEIIDCIFDEEYTSLVPAPFAPSRGLYAGAASYTSWEGKAHMILHPRRCHRYAKGWNDDVVLQQIEDWTLELQHRVAESWHSEGFVTKEDGNERLRAEQIWEERVLLPWAKKAKLQLEDYKKFKASKATLLGDDMAHISSGEGNAIVDCIDDSKALDLVPPLESINQSVPKLYEKVLYYLREANSSGLWPKTTLKRQLVMSSTTANPDMMDNVNHHNSDNQCNTNNISQRRSTQISLSMAHARAKKNKENRASAYSFVEGQGGASGSFSVGGMPGKQCEQPKGNLLFPELMKAAFELEIALCPDREPSSTIAINRNAQFRPHTDNGAGAGQSTSLIVGLGVYSGGELMVEGIPNDIRYKPLEFNGWTQRHWTLPFRGERYSLVWFTPKGCENVRGIDLCAHCDIK